MTTYQTLDPATGSLVKTYKTLSTDESNDRLDGAREALADLKSKSQKERASCLHRVAEKMLARKTDLAKLMALEMGKPLTQGEAEIKKCSATFEYFANNADAFLTPKTVKIESGESQILFEPVGIIFAVMPWNFPFWQVVRVAAPALAAGNSVLFKPASNVPQCSLALESVIKESFGLPLVQTLFVDVKQVKDIIGDDRVHMVTLTGSARAGAAVAKLAGEHLKKVVLELGGSDAFIVLDDASLIKSVPVAVEARLLNSGQSCIAAKRFFVHEKIFDQFLTEFVAEMKRQKSGHPLSAVDIGPLASSDQRDILDEQVRDAKAKGANILCGGAVPKGEGFFYPATVLTNISQDMKVYQEEVFGPVATIMPFKNDDEAIKLANDTEFGLGASIWTNNKSRANYIAEHLEAGTVCINGMVRSDYRLPFGGKKKSGFGRELGQEGLMEYVSTKTIVINSSSTS